MLNNISNILNILVANKTKIAVVLIGLPILAMFVNFFNNYALINITVQAPSTKTEAAIYISSDYGTKKIGGPGLHIIPRYTKSVIAEAGKNIRTQSEISIPQYGYLEKRIELKLDKNADKIAFRSTLDRPCGVYSNTLSRLAQYKCSSPNTLTYYNTPVNKPWLVEKVADVYYPNYTPVPYMGGIIGVSYIAGSDFVPPGPISFVSDTGEVRYYRPPEDIDMLKIRQSKIFTDQNDQTNTRFVIAATDGTIYIGTPESGPVVSYTKITPPNDYKQNLQQTICSINTNSVTCYRGLSQGLGDRTVDSDSIKSSLLRFDLAGNKSEDSEVDITVPLHDLKVTKSGQIYGKSYKSLLYFEKKDARYETSEVSQNIDAIATGESLYFLQDDGVFVVEPNTQDSYQIFHSDNIQPKQLIVSSDKVFILGKVPGNKVHTYAWVLNSEDDTNYGNRLIDKIPAFPDYDTYGSIDLVGDTIKLDLPMTRTSTTQSINEQRQVTLNYLDSIGIDTSALVVSD